LVLESAKLRWLETKPATILWLLESTTKRLSKTTTILGWLEPESAAKRLTESTTESAKTAHRLAEATHRWAESARVSAASAAKSAAATHV
jgi:hypothetical protein